MVAHGSLDFSILAISNHPTSVAYNSTDFSLSSYTWATGQLRLGPEHAARPEEGPRQAQKPESRMHSPGLRVSPTSSHLSPGPAWGVSTVWQWVR